MGVQNENAVILVGSDDGQDSFSDPVDANTLLEIHQNHEFINGMDENIEVTELHDGQNLNGMGENISATDPNQNLAFLNDGYLELNDFANSVVVAGWEDVACPDEIHDDQKCVNCEISNQQELHGVDEFFNTSDEIGDLSEAFQVSPTVENMYVELNDLVNPSADDYPSGEPTDDGMVYFNAPSHYPPAEHDCFLGMNGLMDSTMADPSGPDLVDEYIAYFDATENIELFNLDSEIVNSSALIQPDLASEVNGGSMHANQTSPQCSEANGNNGASSSMTLEAGGQSSCKSDDVPNEPEVQSDNSWDKAFTKHLLSMLGSISSPPAFAAEYPMKGAKSPELYSATHSSSSVHITAGMIQINGLTVTGNGKNWSVQKDGDVGFLLSYGMRENGAGNSVGFEVTPKLHGGLMSFMLRNSFHLLFLSVLLFAASFKIGVYVCSR